eukprot:3822700-Alexandrium_andersonii.AAC.1
MGASNGGLARRAGVSEGSTMHGGREVPRLRGEGGLTSRVLALDGDLPTELLQVVALRPRDLVLVAQVLEPGAEPVDGGLARELRDLLGDELQEILAGLACAI